MTRRWVSWWAVILNAIFILLAFKYETPAIWTALICLFNILIVFGLNSAFNHLLRELYLLTGEAKKNKSVEAAIKNYMVHVNELVNETKHVIANINEIGNSRFTDLVSTIKSADIRSSLTSANDKIRTLRKQEQDGNWITHGVATIAGVKQKGNDISAYCNEVLALVIRYLDANQGGFFVVKTEQGDRYLELMASYAYGKRKFLEKRINPGEGLAGQVLYEQQIVYMTDVPKDYIRITSGLGEALPQSICILPLIFDGIVYGVLEIASFNKFQPAAMEYLKKISESIGYNLGSIAGHKKTESLLEESQKMAEEVKSREEELRQNMEELKTTQEQMKKKEYEMDMVLSSLSTVELDTSGKIIDANEIFLGITGFKPDQIIGKPYHGLIPKGGNDALQYELMLNNILSGKTFSGEFRIVNALKKEIWMAGNFTPIMNEEGKPYKIMVISQFITQDKEKLSELQELVAALKSCFPIAEINPDLSFKTANDLFLSELGIRRLELRNSSPRAVFAGDSFKKVEQYILDSQGNPDNMILDIQHKNGGSKSFNSTLINISNNSNARKKGLLILRNPL